MNFLDYLSENDPCWFIGKVKRYNDERKFGFTQPYIATVDLSQEQSAFEELFFHFTALNTQDPNATQEGQYILGQYGIQEKNGEQKINVSKFFILDEEISNKGKKEFRRLLRNRDCLFYKPTFYFNSVYSQLLHLIVQCIGAKVADLYPVLLELSNDNTPAELIDPSCSLFRVRSLKEKLAKPEFTKEICDTLLEKNKPPKPKTSWIEIEPNLPSLKEALDTIFSLDLIKKSEMTKEAFESEEMQGLLKTQLRKELGSRVNLTVSPGIYLDEHGFDLSKKPHNCFPTLTKAEVLSSVLQVDPICNLKDSYYEHGLKHSCNEAVEQIIEEYQTRKIAYERENSPFWQEIHEKLIEVYRTDNSKFLKAAIPYHRNDFAIPIYSIFPYVKRAFQSHLLQPEVDIAEKIYSFKDGSVKASEFFFEAITKIAKELGFTGKPYLFPIPSASKAKNEARYKYFREYLQEDENFSDGLGLYVYEGLSQGKHKGGSGVIMEKLFLTPTIEGKEIILFDDVTTSGSSITIFSRCIERFGGKVIGAITLGKTTSSSEPSLEWYKHVLTNLFTDKKAHIQEAFSNPSSDYLISQANDFVKLLIRSIENNESLKHDCYIFDLDQTIVDSKNIKPLQDSHRWDEVYRKLSTIRPFDGIIELIQDIRSKGGKVAILSNAKSEYVKKVVAYYSIPSDLALGYSEIRQPKPNPLGLQIVRDNLNTSKEIYIGDSDGDKAFSKNAGIPFIGVDFSGSEWWEVSQEVNSVSDLRDRVFEKKLVKKSSMSQHKKIADILSKFR